MIPKIRVFAKAGTKALFGGGYDRDQMFYEIRDIDFYDEDVTVWGCHRKDCGMCDDTYKIKDVEIMMSTGLKDKEGVDIYEGDILKHVDFDSTQDTVNVVYMKHGSLVFDVKVDEFVYDVPVYGLHPETSGGYEDTLEIIGNIYENPELLEVEE